MKYLHLFDTEADFNSEYYDDERYHKPWVSKIIENKRVDYNKKTSGATYSRTVTYIDVPNGTTYTDTRTGEVGTPITFRAPAPPIWDEEHTCFGWSTEEWPTYAQSATTGFIKTPGSTFTTSTDLTLYANYLITFQGLINDGYVDVNVYGETVELGVAMGIIVKPNNYPKEMVTDFMEVFNSAPNKKVSAQGVVGEGQIPNAFMFCRSINYANDETWGDKYWLTTDEWYDIYNNTPLQHNPCSEQFRFMDWSSKDSVTISYCGATANCVARMAYGPKMPRVLNVHMANGQNFAHMYQTFGNQVYGEGCSSQIINLSSTRTGGKINPNRYWSGKCMQAAFESANNLKEVHGLDTNGLYYWDFAFDGANSIVTIPSDDFGASLTLTGPTQQMFCRCTNLETIEPILYVSDATCVVSMFYWCTKLKNLKLHGINAASNVRGTASYEHDSRFVWDFRDSTGLTQTSVNYIADNATTVDISAAGFTYKNINFPAGTQINQTRVNYLHNSCGWNVYVGETLVPTTN